MSHASATSAAERKSVDRGDDGLRQSLDVAQNALPERGRSPALNPRCIRSGGDQKPGFQGSTSEVDSLACAFPLPWRSPCTKNPVS